MMTSPKVKMPPPRRFGDLTIVRRLPASESHFSRF